MDVTAGRWCAYALGKIASKLSLDQKDDYDHSPTFDSDVSDASRSIIGRTIIDLRVASDQPQALIAAHLDYININGSIEIFPVAIVHPITGGKAPAAPPITIFCGVFLFSHIVYTKK